MSSGKIEVVTSMTECPVMESLTEERGEILGALRHTNMIYITQKEHPGADTSKVPILLPEAHGPPRQLFPTCLDLVCKNNSKGVNCGK